MASLILLAACAGKVQRPSVSAQAAPAQSLASTAPSGGRAGEAPLKVGLLVPLSGPSAALGTAMLSASELALFDRADDRFVLLPRDTLGSPAGTVAAAREVVADGAQMILGPVFGADAAAIRAQTQGANLPVLAFSTDWTVAGGNIFVLGFGPQEQVERVTGYARARGIGRFAALAPRSLYGDAVVATLSATAQRLGAQVARIERYQADGSDLAAAVQRLATPALAPAGLPAAAAFGAVVAGDPGFDALLLAEGGDRLLSLVRQLPASRIDPTRVRLIGTGLWDEATLGREPLMVGAWFAAPDPAARGDFEARYQALYGQAPPRLATLAYDATSLAAVLAQQGGARPYDFANLTRATGFAGVDGAFRLQPGGRVERALAVLEVAPQGPRVIDPAPLGFEPLIN
ncbi:MAG: ABC transporter substrate-binding protein [Azospirillum sp.]|nr:ABC transporter substrate-binding protein [Azospirillum sp.]